MEQAKLNGVKHSLDKAQEQLQARTVELDEREKDISAKDKKVRRCGEGGGSILGIMFMLFFICLVQLKELERELVKREGKLKPFEDKVAKKELEVRTKDIEVKSKETDLKRREREVEAREAGAAEIKAAAAAAAEKLAVRETKVKEREVGVSELEKSFAVSSIHEIAV